jgi:hypothetical protein
MYYLSTPTSKITLTTGAAGSIAVQVAYADFTAPSTTGIPNIANLPLILTAATVDIMPPPAAGVARVQRQITVINNHTTVANPITINHTDGTNSVVIFTGTLLVGESIICDADGALTYYSQGKPVTVNVSSGQLVRRTVLLSGASGIFSPLTKAWIAKEKGGGGGCCGSGGANTAATAAACGGGGCEGGYGETALIATAPSAAFTYSIGAGGAAGAATGGNGGSGSQTTFTTNAITYAVNGGSGGVGMTLAIATPATTLGGTNSGPGSNMALNLPGATGEGGVQFSATIAMSGAGAGAGGGNARNTAGAGVSAVSNTGSGGGGGLVINGSVAVAGAAGANGYIILEEYT